MKRALYPRGNHPDIDTSLNNLGVTFGALGDRAKQLKYHKDALNMRRELYPEQNHPDIATSLSNLGLTYRVLGETTKGIK